MSDFEISSLLAVATIVRLNAINSNNINQEIFSDNAGPAALAEAAVKMSKVVRQWQTEGQPVQAAAGMVWVHTLRSMHFPEARELGKEMWYQLQRGINQAPEAFAELGRLGMQYPAAAPWFDVRFVPDPLTTNKAES